MNERYATDKNITSVIESIIACYHANDNSGYFDVKQFGSKPPSASEIHQREMFLRFFEELAYAAETGSLNKEKVCYYFSYYAVAASLMGEKFVEDYNDGCWKRFRVFAGKMQKMAKAKKYFKMSYEEDSQIIRVLDLQ